MTRGNPGPNAELASHADGSVRLVLPDQRSVLVASGRGGQGA
jgi:hypothetical protein